jgi:dinuclear metal center YbgI/SA1388 family protein
MKRDELVEYLDQLLEVEAIEDRSNNGLQVEGAETVQRVAFAVDAGLAAFQDAAAAGAQMLIAHHGLFWGEPIMITGIQRRRLQTLLDAGVSLYGVHLPLDVHPELGNNAVLARWLDLQDTAPYGQYKGRPLIVTGSLPEEMALDAFAARVEEVLGKPVIQVWPFGRPEVRRVGIVSGGAGFLLGEVAEAGVDVYFTGEVSHTIYHQAQELGLNVVFGGHYATETAGLKALAEHLEENFELETVFLDLPTGA